MAKKSGRIRILLVDDHEVVRAGLKMVLNRHSELEVVGEADGMEEALALTRARRPHVVLMDLRLKTECGIDVCRRIREHTPKIRVLMLTAFADESLLLGALLAGAHGYVLKEVNSGDLYAAVKRVVRSPWKTPGRTRLLRKVVSVGEEDLLTGQEARLLEKVQNGFSNREIGRDLGLGEQAVRRYLVRILDRLRVPTPPVGACLFQPAAASLPRPACGTEREELEPASGSRSKRSAARRSP